MISSDQVVPQRVNGRVHRRGALWATLQLMRPANVVTALADVLAGFAAAAASNWSALAWLLLATAGLYAGGVVLNDVFDARLDAVERPERPLPRGDLSVAKAAGLGVVLLMMGIGAAFAVAPVSGLVALAAAGCAVLYDAWGKHRPFLGPLNMGLCRGLNLMLGVSAAPALLGQRWYLALFPLVYIAAITAVSRGEVAGGRRETGLGALALIGAVLGGVLALGAAPGFGVVAALPFLALLAWRVLPPFWRAWRAPQPATIGRAVSAGVLSLIVLDATFAAGYAGVVYGALVLSLLPVSLRLARAFAVT